MTTTSKNISIWLCALLALTGCAVNKAAYNTQKKYAPEQLQHDYTVFRETLEEAHPSLYWYTPKDSMDYYFTEGFGKLKDSLTEQDFRKILMYVTAKVNCGHTTVRSSKKYAKYNDTVRSERTFPLAVKIWGDSMVVAENLHRNDSVLKRGTPITAINGKTVKQLTDTLFNYISTDGYNATHKAQILSGRGTFGSLYTMLYGFSPYYQIQYTDSLGNSNEYMLPLFYPRKDSTLRRPPVNKDSVTKRASPRPAPERTPNVNRMRVLKLDTLSKTAVMEVNTFSKGHGLKRFFKKSFKTLRKTGIENLIIDVRTNGGGNVNNSTTLTRYIADKNFVIADSLYAITRKNKYGKYIENYFPNKVFMLFYARKKGDKYHFRYFEKHKNKPIKKNHFNGQVYVLTGGYSFSATTLFTGTVKPQDNVTVVGEETGGGAYGNSAWLIPDVTLPNTKVRFRLPRFRLVIDKNIPHDGLGVQPEIFVGPSSKAIKRGSDYKLEAALRLIAQKEKAAKQSGN